MGHPVRKPPTRTPILKRDTTDSAKAPAAAPATEASPDKWLSYDAATNTVTFELIAGPFTFNGYRNGGGTLLVPSKANMVINFVNKDGTPHSAIVISGDGPIPNSASDPAIPRAYTNKALEGLPQWALALGGSSGLLAQLGPLPQASVCRPGQTRPLLGHGLFPGDGGVADGGAPPHAPALPLVQVVELALQIPDASLGIVVGQARVGGDHGRHSRSLRHQASVAKRSRDVHLGDRRGIRPGLGCGRA